MTEARGPRFIGLDIHKAHVMVAIVDAQQQLLLKPCKVSSSQFQNWAEGHLQPSDQVVLEASGDAWLLVDQLQPLVERVAVANPNQVKLIASSMVKTDKRDALTLARLLAVNLIPEVWVPVVAENLIRGCRHPERRAVECCTSGGSRRKVVRHRARLCEAGRCPAR